MIVGSFGVFDGIVEDVTVTVLGYLRMQHSNHSLEPLMAFRANTGAAPTSVGLSCMEKYKLGGKKDKVVLLTCLVFVHRLRVISCSLLITRRVNTLDEGRLTFPYISMYHK